MEKLGEIRAATRTENLCIPVAADGRDICLHFLSKIDYIRSCTRSHAPVQEHTREAVLGYIRISK